MNIKIELLKRLVSDMVGDALEMIDIDADKIADTQATIIVGEIIDVMRNGPESDFELVEEIVCIFEKYGISCGRCHDFS